MKKKKKKQQKSCFTLNERSEFTLILLCMILTSCKKVTCLINIIYHTCKYINHLFTSWFHFEKYFSSNIFFSTSQSLSQKYFHSLIQSELASGNHICDFPQSVRLLIQSELASLIQSKIFRHFLKRWIHLQRIYSLRYDMCCKQTIKSSLQHLNNLLRFIQTIYIHQTRC